jgi:hypothetical protein
MVHALTSRTTATPPVSAQGASGQLTVIQTIIPVWSSRNREGRDVTCIPAGKQNVTPYP